MKTIFNKVLAGVTTVALVATLLVGINVGTEVKADTVTLKPWSFYSAGQMYRSLDHDGWPIRYFKSVTTTAGEVKTGWDANFPNKQYVDGGEETWTSTKVSDGFTADIAATGWDGEYKDGTCIGDNPYMLRAMMDGVELEAGHMYTVSFDYKWTQKPTDKGELNAPEKSIQFGITNEFTESVTEQKVTVATGSTESVSLDFTHWAGGKVNISIAMGCFLYSNQQGLTTEGVAAAGEAVITNFKIVDNGRNPEYVEPPQKETPATVPEVTTKDPSAAVTPKPATPVVKKLGKVKKVKAKNNKKKTIKITWNKVANAKKYQVKVGKKTYNTKKTKLIVKKLKKGKKYTVRVRAKATGYKTGAWSKKVKVKIKK